MESVPLRALPANNNSHIASALPSNITDQYSTVTHDNDESGHPVQNASENASTNSYQPGCFTPLSDEDMAQHPELPELNYKPASLQDGYLVFLIIWFVVCFMGVSSLAVFSQMQLSWLHLESQYGYNLWVHSPAIVGFITTVLWRGTLQSYNRIIPYVRMANLPLSNNSSGHLSNSGPSFLNVPLTGIPGSTVAFGALVTLWNSRDYLSFVVNLSVIFTNLLTPIKSGIFQLVKDESGWRIQISMLLCVIAMVVYLWLFVVTVAVALHLRKNRTGLKWSPSTISAQLALLQGSNILSMFKDIPTERPWPLDLAMAKWVDKGLIPRLGYWKQEGTNAIIHGIRFLPVSTANGTDYRGYPNSSSNSEDIPDAPSRIQSPESILDNNHEQSNTESIGSLDADIGNGERASPTIESAEGIDRVSPIGYATTAIRQRNLKPDVNRIWNYSLSDWYLLAITVLGTSALTAAIVAWVRGDIHRPFNFPLYHIAHASSMTNLIPNMIRNIIFTFLPAMLFGVFNATILAADIYQRSMIPVENMVKPLPDKDRKRLCTRETDIKGATAHDTMLLDYITPDLVSCILLAADAGHFKIILGTVLATLCNSVFIVSGSLFVFHERDNNGYAVNIQTRNFYAAFSIMVVYCTSIWIMRPQGAVRTCRRLHTIMDLAMLIHQSHILQCPEFWVQNSSDTEDHLKSQVMLADRIYRFGVYTGIDTHDYVGISICEVPAAWTTSSADIACLHYSTQLAKDALTFGVYDSTSLSFTQEFLMDGPRTWLKHKRVYSNEHRSWSRRARKLVGRTRQADSESELRYEPGSNSGIDFIEGLPTSYHRPSR
ncbi:hypothetical protein FLONG3_3254 [Fusarium longipes]|uniref:Uncharacterized protein n=1 Tax=Fusarium longipes TaxID=694270 RepID=A0A395T2U1_9HYPO|nr:hypothetical protein FLONG3_3254 [Fusarium longipes]